MKKLLLLFAGIVLAAGAANAQDLVRKGTLAFNAGIGFGNGYSNGYWRTTIPPIHISGEGTVVDNLIQGKNGAISVGGYLGFRGYKSVFSDAQGTYGWKYNNVIIGVRGSFHYVPVAKLDTYAGLMLAYEISSHKDYGTLATGATASSGGGFLPGFYLGARYWFTDGFGAFAEVGYGAAYFNLGVSFKM